MVKIFTKQLFHLRLNVAQIINCWSWVFRAFLTVITELFRCADRSSQKDQFLAVRCIYCNLKLRNIHIREYFSTILFISLTGGCMCRKCAKDKVLHRTGILVSTSYCRVTTFFFFLLLNGTLCKINERTLHPKEFEESWFNNHHRFPSKWNVVAFKK